MRRIFLTLLIAILSIPVVQAQGDVTGGATVVRAEYFFDTDPGYGNATIINNVTSGDNNLSLSVEGLSPGAHMLYVRSQASDGVWSATQAHPLLLIQQRPVQATRVEYFYDTDPGYGKGKSVGNLTDGDNNIVVSVEGLSYGVHHLCFRAQDNQGVWSQVANYSVFVTSPKTANAMRIEYFFDTDPGYGLGTSIGVAQDEDATYALPLDGLSMGAHMLYLRVQDNHGRWSSVQSHPIYVMSNMPDVVAVEYFFDDDDPGEGQATAVPLPNFKTEPFAFEANTAGLSAGEHHLKVRLKKNNGFWTLFDAAAFTVEGTVVAEAEPYAVLSDNNTVLTFYYDEKKDERNGMSVGPFDSQNYPTWYEYRETITTAVFDDSFANCTTLTSTGFWFYHCNNLTAIIGISNLKTDNVMDMRCMFTDCLGLTSLDVTNFKTDNVTDMGFMFAGCSGLTSIDVSNFKTDNATNIRSMFAGCSGLTSLDVTNFKTDNVTFMMEMFHGCSGLTSLDLSSFKTDHVKYMREMFRSCSGLTSLDVTNFKTDNVTDMWGMFAECSDLTTIYAGSGWSTAAVTEGDQMFFDCKNLVGGAGTVYDLNHIDYTYAHIDGGPSNPGYFTDKNAAPAIAEAYAVLSENNTVLTFYYDTEKQARGGIDINNGYLDKTVVSPYGTATKAVIDASFADYRPTSTGYWFQNCGSLTNITGMENLKTDNVTDMHYMFAGCSSLTNIDVSGFKTDNVMYMIGMFSGCSSLTNLDVNSFKTDNVSYMGDMFGNCSSLVSLNISSFKTDNVVDMFDMFDGCSSLAAIQAGNANITAEGYNHIGNPNLLVYVNDASLAPQSVQNVVVNGVAKEIVLTDEVGANDNNNFFVPQRFMAERITYTRNFTQQTQPNVSRGWESISLPFNVQNIVHETKGDLSPFGSTAEGKKFWLRRLADNGLTRALQIEANVPYVISMPNSTEYTDLYNLSGLVTFSAENTTVPITTPQVLSLADSSIVMMPTMLRVNRSSSVWALNVGEVRGQYLEGSVFERDYRMVRPFQAYTVHHSDSPAPRFVPLNDLMNGGATGIESLTPALSEGEGAWYTIDGRRLQQKPDQKGVYLHNGRKVVVH